MKFIITGVQRSGTTLLRLMLNANESIAIPEEADFLKPLLTRVKSRIPRGYINRLIHDKQFLKWRFTEKELEIIKTFPPEKSSLDFIHLIYNLYANKEGKTILGDKSPSLIRFLPKLSLIFENPKLIHIVRDPRDVYMSLKNRGHFSATNPYLFALEWRIKEKLILRAYRYFSETMLVRYEDLIAHPRTELLTVSSFLDAEYNPKMLEFFKQSSDYIDTGHSKLIFERINQDNSYKWKSKLSKRDADIIQSIASPLLLRYNYVRNKQQKTHMRNMLYAYIWSIPRIFQIIFRSLSQRFFFYTGRTLTKSMYE